MIELNSNGFGAVLILAIALVIAAVPTAYVVTTELRNSDLSSKPVIQQDYDSFLDELDDYYADNMNPSFSEGFLSVLDNVFGDRYAIELTIYNQDNVVYRVFASKSAHTIKLTKGVPDETIRMRISIEYDAAKEMFEEYKTSGNVSGLEQKILTQKIIITPITEATKLTKLLEFL